MLEILQNCIVFNDGAFELFTDKKSRPRETIYLEDGEPLIFGKDKEKGLRLDGLTPEVVELGSEYSKDDLWVHDETDKTKADLLTRFFEHPHNGDHLKFPRPFGVLYDVERPTYDEGVTIQNAEAIKRNEPDLDALLQGPETWEVS